MLMGELVVVGEVLTRLAAKPAWSRADAEVLADCEALHVLEQRVAGLKLLVLGELDERGLAREVGATSTTGWLRWRLRMSSGVAGTSTRLARALRQHPDTARRLAAGEITQEQAHAITDSLTALAADLPTLDGDMSALAADLPTLDGEVATVDGDVPTLDGQVSTLDGKVPTIDGNSAQLGSTNPVDGTSAAHLAEGPVRSPGWVNRDGALVRSTVLGRVEELLLDHARTLDPKGLRVAGQHALATIAPEVAEEAERRALADTERRAFGARRLDLHEDIHGGTVIRGYLDREGTVLLRTALGPLSTPRGVGDERSAGQRRADALADVCQRVIGDGTLPAQGGQPTQVVVTTRYDPLRQALGTGHLDTGEQVSAEAVRRLACNAAILPAVLGTQGQVLDVGRARRLFAGPLRRALDIRDGGCAFPGCDRPCSWAEAHHLLSWLDGGPTEVNNGVLVCRIHHRHVHEPDGWRVRLAQDGLPEFIPPPWIDPEQRPLRNTRNQIRAP